ncbi:tail assembly chaperone [Salinicoccus sp. Marseille-QA3877]
MAEKVEGITELRINDRIYKAKGTYLFGKTAQQYAQNEVNEKTGKEQKGDGVTSIFMGLMQQDPDKLIEFWHCATSHYGKEAPKFEAVSGTLSDIAEKEDLLPYFVGALRLLNEGGYYKGKLQTLWFMMNTSSKRAKEDEKEDMKAQIETFKDMYKMITGNPPYQSEG